MSTNNQNAEPVDYQRRMLAFVDILGWKARVERSISERALVAHLVQVMELVRHRYFETMHVPEPLRDSFPPNFFPEISQMSDSIVVSRPAQHLPYSFTMELGFLQRILLSHGLLSRGGVTIGDVYHNGAVAFGPALTKAYLLESDAAIYPRIIFDTECAAHFETADTIGDFHKIQSVRRDNDGLLFIDYLGFLAKDHAEDANEAMGRLRGVIATGMQAARGHSRVFEKYAWLASYYNAIAKEFPLANMAIIP